MARVLVAADIKPRPAVERALPHTGDIVRHQIVAETVALVGGAPGQAALRLDGEPDTVSDAGSIKLPVLPLRIEGEHRRAFRLIAPGRAERLRARPRL